jgi:hypothetical protein
VAPLPFSGFVAAAITPGPSHSMNKQKTGAMALSIGVVTLVPIDASGVASECREAW